MQNLEKLLTRYREMRAQTVAIAAPLSVDDQIAQSMPEASPTKWHLGHTTWFFEKMLLEAFAPSYVSYRGNAAWNADWVFNSYYESVGERQSRGDRSLLTRPTLPEVHEYRRAIDARVSALAIEKNDAAQAMLELAIEHEEQHQELLLTDIKSVLAPQKTAYFAGDSATALHPSRAKIPAKLVSFDGGLVEIGTDTKDFAFDNERPRHKCWLDPFALSSRLVTQGEWLAFMNAGGYDDAAHWLSDGWALKNKFGWKAPLYWEKSNASPSGFITTTMRGESTIELDFPVCHVSFYEADAFARWSKARLPTEEEWEHALAQSQTPSSHGGELAQMFGDVWQWTASPYVSYPRFVPFSGTASEYNGKFMCNQLVLRGSSCFTPKNSVRATYRNFFPPEARWQMSGVRLAEWP